MFEGWENDYPIQPAAQYFSHLVRTRRDTFAFERLGSNSVLTPSYLYDSIPYVLCTGYLSAFCHSPRPVRRLFHDSPGPLPVPNSLCLLPAYPSSKKVQNHANLAKPRKMNTCKNRATTFVK